MRSEVRWIALRAGAGALLFSALAFGCARAPRVRVENAWMRPVAVGQTTAAYFTLVNDSPDTLVLVKVDVPAVEMAMMHETVHEGAMLSMRKADRFVVAPHAKLRFSPGGNHVMAMQALVGLAEGDTTAMWLDFADGTKLRATARVRS